MPLFTFECRDCDETFETLVAFGRPTDEISCPRCGGQRTRKKLSLVARMAPAGPSVSGQVSAPSCSTGST